ncbi:nucleoside-diphosphate-sugar epimerase [Bradyrhizobium sp. USDA 3240]
MRILLTGCSGFVGSALGPRLVAEGHELFCVCRPGTSVAFGTKVVWDGAASIEASSFPKAIDAVVHAAQSRRYRDFPADSREMFDVNVGMTMRLLDWAAQAAVKHFCLLSSGAVYEPFAAALREDAGLAPPGFLGASKFASEVVAKPFSSIFSLSILRLFFPYGPGQRDRLIPQLVRRIQDGGAIQLSGGTEGISPRSDLHRRHRRGHPCEHCVVLDGYAQRSRLRDALDPTDLEHDRSAAWYRTEVRVREPEHSLRRHCS